MLKTIIASLIIASATVSFAAKASAGPQGPSESFYQYRASQNHDNGGN